MAQWPDVGERIKQRLLAVGYVKNGRPDVMRFCIEQRFFPQYAYKWINAGVLPERDNLLRLAACLDVSPAWLLFGDEVTPKPRQPSPARGGLTQQTPLAVPASRRFKKKHPKERVSARKGEALCQLCGRTTACPMHRSPWARTRGSLARVA